MPLHGENRQRFVRKGFDRTVIGAGERAKPLPQPSDRLVVRAVDHKARAVQHMQQPCFCTDGMQAVNAADLAVAFDMLAQRAAEEDVEHLKPPADAENQQAAGKEIPHERKLARIARFVDIRRAGRQLPVAPGRDISPAGEEQRFCRGGLSHCLRACKAERGLIIFQGLR